MQLYHRRFQTIKHSESERKSPFDSLSGSLCMKNAPRLSKILELSSYEFLFAAKICGFLFSEITC